MSECSLHNDNNNNKTRIKNRKHSNLNNNKQKKLTLNFIVFIIMLANLNATNLVSSKSLNMLNFNSSIKNSIKIAKDIIFPANTPEPKVSKLDKIKLTEYINKVRRTNDKNQGSNTSSASLSSDQQDKE